MNVWRNRSVKSQLFHTCETYYTVGNKFANFNKRAACTFLKVAFET